MIGHKFKLLLLMIALIGAGIATRPYLAHLIDARKSAQLPTAVKIADLKTGSFAEIERPSSRVFVMRDFDDQLYVFSVPYSDTAYWLPEFDWAHPGVPCAEFGPDNKEGMLIKDGAFRCRLPDHGEFFRYEHSWSYSGRNLGYRTADMKVAEFEIADGMILLSR